MKRNVKVFKANFFTLVIVRRELLMSLKNLSGKEDTVSNHTNSRKTNMTAYRVFTKGHEYRD